MGYVATQRSESEKAMEDLRSKFEGHFTQMQKQFETLMSQQMGGLQQRIRALETQASEVLIMPQCEVIPVTIKVLDVRMWRVVPDPRSAKSLDKTEASLNLFPRRCSTCGYNRACDPSNGKFIGCGHPIPRLAADTGLFSVPYSGLWNLASDAIMPLQLLVNLKTLKLVDMPNLTHLKFLATMKMLAELDISYCPGITSLDDIAPTSGSLASLDCVACTGIKDVQPLSTFLSLRSLELGGSGVVNILALSHLPLLTVSGLVSGHSLTQ